MITPPTQAELRAAVLATLLAKKTNLDISDESVPGIRIAGLVELAFGIHKNVSVAETSVIPSEETSSAILLKLATLRFGESPKIPASTSSGSSVLQVTGTDAAAAVTAGLVLTHNSGLTFQLDSGGVVGVGTANFDLESISTGISANLQSGDTLTFQSAPANIQQTATLIGNLTGGDDEETDAELLVRLIKAYRNPPAGGRFYDYWAWALKVAGVGGAYVYGPSDSAVTGRRGLGTVDVGILTDGTGDGREASAALVQDVQDYSDALKPALAALLVAAPAPDLQDIEIGITPKSAAYEADWDDGGTPGVVSSYTPGTKTITWNAALPVNLTDAVDAGETPRIFCAGQVLTVLSYAGQDTVISETPSPNPANPDSIYSGGPLSAPCLAAVKGLVDLLGPSRASGANDPNQDWDDTLRVNALSGALIERTISATGTVVGVEGTLDADTLTPVSNVQATDNPDPGFPEFIAYDTITIKYV